jgi:hypothetical protein
MQKQNYVTIFICASLCVATLFITFGQKVRATDPTILDYSSADAEGNIHIGNENASIDITSGGTIYLKTNRTISFEGLDSEEQPREINLQAQQVAVGDVNGEHLHARIVIDNMTPDINGDGTITASVSIAQP